MGTPGSGGDRRQAFLGRYPLLTTGIALAVSAYLSVTLVLDLTGDNPPPTAVVVLRALSVVIVLSAAASDALCARRDSNP